MEQAQRDQKGGCSGVVSAPLGELVYSRPSVAAQSPWRAAHFKTAKSRRKRSRAGHCQIFVSASVSLVLIDKRIQLSHLISRIIEKLFNTQFGGDHYEDFQVESLRAQSQPSGISLQNKIAETKPTDGRIFYQLLPPVPPRHLHTKLQFRESA